MIPCLRVDLNRWIGACMALTLLSVLLRLTVFPVSWWIALTPLWVAIGIILISPYYRVVFWWECLVWTVKGETWHDET